MTDQITPPAPTGPETLPVELDAADRRKAAGAIEALLLMATEPVPVATLAAALELPVETTGELITELRTFYDDTERGFELRHVGGGWRYYTRVEHAEVITAAVVGGQQSKLSQAALETLAVIAYRQPISRARVSAVRGVNVDGVIRTLVARDLITESGVDEQTGAMVFVTTDHFLERMGLDALDDLPPLAPHLPDVAEMEAELSGLVTAVDDEGTAGGDGDATGSDGRDPSTHDHPALRDPSEPDEREQRDEQDDDAAHTEQDEHTERSDHG